MTATESHRTVKAWNPGAVQLLWVQEENEMAMLSARFQDAAAAQRVVEMFVTRLGAAPDLVIASPEAARPAPQADAVSDRHDPAAMPPVASVRVSVYDNAIDMGSARDTFEAAGGFDIRPIQ